MRKLSLIILIVIVGLFGAGCGDEETTPQNTEPDASPPISCRESSECPDNLVCRTSVCIPGPACEDITECAESENCTDGFCVYDPEVCIEDAECLVDQICQLGQCRDGCRTNADCSPTDECNEDHMCVRQACTDIPCEEGFDCDEETGECILRACDGGCEEPLMCRVSDDQCVECLDDDDCGTGEHCPEDGFCAEDTCETHDDCEEGTFCINEYCSPPPDCTNDALEPNDEFVADDLPLFVESTYEDLVACPYNSDYFQVVADGNHSLTIDLSFSHEQGDVNLELLNTVLVTFAERTSETDNESMTVNIFKTGVYTIHVFQVDGGTQGVTYDMTISTGAEVEVAADLCLIDGFEPNDTPADATEIFTGRWTGPTICSDESDYYLFPTQAGEMIEVCVIPSELVDVQLGLEFMQSDETILHSAAGTVEFCIEDDLLVGDDFLVRVFATTPGEESPYYLRVEKEPGCLLYEDSYDVAGQNDAIPTGEDPPLASIAADTPTTLRVCPNDSDYWPVPLLLGDELDATINFTNDNGDLQLKLHRPGGAVLVGSTTSDDLERIIYEAEENGTYYLRVYGEGEDMGEYVFEYAIDPYCVEDGREENDSSDVLSVLELDEVPGLWLCANDEDWFGYTISDDGSPPTEAEFRLTPLDDGRDLNFSVTSPVVDATAVVGVADGDDLVVTFTAGDILVGTGNIYRIRVWAAEDVQNTYDLTISFVD